MNVAVQGVVRESISLWASKIISCIIMLDHL
jgi:hypothetical protein